MISVTKVEAEAMLQTALEDRSWVPSEVRDRSCSCHISAPCSKCCLDGDYLDEFIEDQNLKIVLFKVDVF